MLRTVPHTPRLAICYKNFAQVRGISHIGLGVSAMQNARALRTAGYIVEIWPIMNAADLTKQLAADRSLSTLAHHVPVTHVVISAPWIPTADLVPIVQGHPGTEFVVVSHSNVGFLQADPTAISILRTGSNLEQTAPNFHIAANSGKLQTWWTAAYGTRMLVLPNMYPFEAVAHKKWTPGGLLRIGCFGAVRPLKNVLTAAAAALETGVRLRVSQLEFHISAGRVEGGNSIVSAIHEMYLGVPRSSVIQNAWASWPQFLTTVGSMDLMLQPSYTESFNMVTADGIARGVPSVIGDAIDWCPTNWIASTDSASDVANKSITLLHDPSAVAQGVAALKSHNAAALIDWKDFLKLYP